MSVMITVPAKGQITLLAEYSLKPAIRDPKDRRRATRGARSRAKGINIIEGGTQHE
jgi:hypothetical protein